MENDDDGRGRVLTRREAVAISHGGSQLVLAVTPASLGYAKTFDIALQVS